MYTQQSDGWVQQAIHNQLQWVYYNYINCTHNNNNQSPPPPPPPQYPINSVMNHQP